LTVLKQLRVQHEVWRDIEYYYSLGAGYFGMFAMFFQILCGNSIFLQKENQERAVGPRFQKHKASNERWGTVQKGLLTLPQ